MNSLERVSAAFEHHRPDRTPAFEYVMHSPCADYYLGRPLVSGPFRWAQAVKDLGWQAAVRQAAVDHVDLALALEHDIIYAVPCPPYPRDDWHPAPPLMGAEPEDRLEERVLRTEAKPPMMIPQHSMMIFEHIAAELARRDSTIVMKAPTYSHGVWDDVDLMQTMLIEPEIAHAHFAQCTRQTLALVEYYRQVGVKIIGVGGDFAGNRPLISPKAYRDFIVPGVRESAQAVRAAGCWSVNASDGNLWSVIDDFLVECEVDGYIEIDLHAGMSLDKLRAQYGKTHTFLGNLDCGNTLCFGTPDMVYDHVTECLTLGADEANGGAGGHILTASNAITAAVPIANYEALRRARMAFYEQQKGGS